MRKLSILVLVVAILVSSVVYYRTTVPLLMNGAVKLLTIKETYFPSPGLEVWTPEARAFNSFVMAGFDPNKKPNYLTMREDMESLAILFPPPSGVKISKFSIGNVPVMEFIPEELDSKDVILFFHGGGMVVGSAEAESGSAGYLAKQTKSRVISVDYRLVPENNIQDAIDDALTVYKHLIDVEGIKSSQIKFHGCSAGGFMALITALAINQAGLPKPAAIAPWASPTYSGLNHLSTSKPLSEWDSRKLDPKLYGVGQITVADHLDEVLYANEANAATINKYYSDLRGLPKMNIQVSQHEWLLDGNIQLVEELKKAGNDVQFNVIPNMWHCPSIVYSSLSAGRKALDELAEWMKNV